MSRLFLAFFLFSSVASADWKCVKTLLSRFVQENIVGSWPKAKFVFNGRNPWVPLRPQITRDRVIHDFVEQEKLVLIQETSRRITLRNTLYDWTISFIKSEDSGVGYCDLDDDEKRFWIADILSEKDLLRYYFDDKYIKMEDLPE